MNYRYEIQNLENLNEAYFLKKFVVEFLDDKRVHVWAVGSLMENNLDDNSFYNDRSLQSFLRTQEWLKKNYPELML
jgi:hypothetical protein